MKNRAEVRNLLLFVGALAFVAKCYLAWTTTGTLDVHTWTRNLSDVRAIGGLGLYHRNYPVAESMNYLPFMIHFIYGLIATENWTRLPPHFIVRLPSIFADIGIIFVVAKLLDFRRLQNTSEGDATSQTFSKLMWVALSPIAILVSGFHGNTDAVMMFFVVLSLYFLVTEKPAWLVGLAFGMSVNIKIVPLVFVPLLLLYLREPRRQVEYSISALATCVIGGMPYLAQDAPFILRRVFGYGGQYNNWGLGRLLGFMPPQLQFLNVGFESLGKYLLLTIILVLSWWMNRRNPTKNATSESVPIELQMATIVTCFLVLTPAFGYQYLAWIVPLLPLWNGRAIGFFTVCSTLYLLSVYTFRWRTWSWYADTPWLVNNWKEHIVILETLCWSSVLVLFYLMLKKVAQMRTRSVSDGSSVR